MFECYQFCFLLTQHYFVTSNSFNSSLLFHILDSSSNTGIILHFDQHLLSSINITRVECTCNIPAKQNINTLYTVQLTVLYRAQLNCAMCYLTICLLTTFSGYSSVDGTFQTYSLCKALSLSFPHATISTLPGCQQCTKIAG